MNIDECHLGNLPAMVRRPISVTSSPIFGRRQNIITITVAHRLAHLIFRMETQPRWAVAIGAKWYLDNIPLIEGLGMNIVQPFIDRLTVAVNRYQEQNGPIDTTQFASLVEFSGVPPQRVLYGFEIFFVTGPCFGEPLRNLSRWISYEMWSQTVNDI